jgi:ABC-type uncharacterized transport system involved in gliding motility auxiliary subunit
MPLDSDLDKLFKAWGVEMEPKMVAGDRRAARRVNAGTGQRVVAMDYVAWLALDDTNLNHDDPITADLTHVNMASAGILDPVKDAKTKFTPLVSTSTDSMPIPVEKIQGMPDIGGLLQNFKPDGKPLVLAAHITGPADTAFPDGPPKDDKAKDATAKDQQSDASAKDAGAKDAPPVAPQIKSAVKPINVVVVADTDILEDRFWVQSQDFFGQTVTIPIANNGDFIANCIDVLAGGDDLISLRSRGSSARPFELVNDIQRAADTRYQATEKDLETKLKDTQDKIKQLSDQGGRPGVALATEQTQAIDNFRSDMIGIRRQLRQVQLALRQDIDRLQAWTEFFDIAFVPILVGLAAIVIGIVRLRRRARHVRAVS